MNKKTMAIVFGLVALLAVPSAYSTVAYFYSGEFFIDGIYPTDNLGDSHGAQFRTGDVIQYHFVIEQANPGTVSWHSGKVFERRGDASEVCTGLIVSDVSSARGENPNGGETVFYGAINVPTDATEGETIYYDLCQLWGPLPGQPAYYEHVSTTWITVKDNRFPVFAQCQGFGEEQGKGCRKIKYSPEKKRYSL